MPAGTWQPHANATAISGIPPGLDEAPLARHDVQRMKIQFRDAHALPMDELRRRVEARVALYVSKYPHVPISGLYRWRDTNIAVASYRGGEGVVELGDGHVAVELDLPFFARPFRTRIENFVRDEIQAVIKG